MHGSHGDLFLSLASWSSFFFLIWNHDVYQSFQIAVKFVMLFMFPNNVSNCLLFLWQFFWGTTFWHFNMQCDTLYSRLMHLQNYDLYTFREMWGYKTNGRKELAGWIYMIEEISRIECWLKRGEHRMTWTHCCIN